MKRLAIVFALLLAACASGQRPRGPQFNTAQPGEVIAAELAFARLAQERGQWTAFRETATAEAEMFVPQRINAQTWLRGRADPARSVTWQPHAVWSSCDGSFAVTRGRWQNASASGAFATVWQRQRDGGYKWVLDMSLTDDRTDPATDTIAAKVADCRNGPTPPVVPIAPVGWDFARGESSDGTLRWTSGVNPDGMRRIVVQILSGTTYETVLALDGRDVD